VEIRLDVRRLCIPRPNCVVVRCRRILWRIILCKQLLHAHGSLLNEGLQGCPPLLWHYVKLENANAICADGHNGSTHEDPPGNILQYPA